MYPYLTFLLVFFLAPTLVLGWYVRRDIVRYRRTGVWILFFVYAAGFFWDWLSWRTALWRYDTAPTLGLWIGGLPVEEYVGFYVLSSALMFVVTLVVLRRARGCSNASHTSATH